MHRERRSPRRLVCSDEWRIGGHTDSVLPGTPRPPIQLSSLLELRSTSGALAHRTPDLTYAIFHVYMAMEEGTDMQINPGGRLQTKDVIGRDHEIARYWTILDRQSLVISAERRIGKTHILLKMQDECPTAYLPIYQDLEAVHSIADLIRSIYRSAQQFSGKSASIRARVAKWSALVPPKIAGIRLPTGDTTWQTFLSDAFDHLIELSANGRILILWDEFPLMLHNIRHGEGPQHAIQLLDYLRALRLDRANKIRFLFTGSVGLHLVLRSLREAGNTNDPVNDMMSVTVPPTSNMDTCRLATELLKGTSASQADIPSLAVRIAGEVGGFPYYVHHVVDQLDQLRRPPTLSDVSSAVDKLVYGSHDPANLNYYVTRLNSYYTVDDRSRALLVLDTLAGQPSPTSLPSLLNLCKHRDPSLPEEVLRGILTILTEDHYIEAQNFAGTAVYDFRWQLVKKWWKEKRT